MGGIGQNLQLHSDSSEILCAISTVTTLMWVTARYAHPAWRTPLQVRVYLYQYLL